MDNLKEFDSANRKPGNKTQNIIIAVLAVACCVLAYLYYAQKKQTNITIVELTNVNTEKEELTFEYQNLLTDYEELTSSNDSLNAQLLTEKERIKTLITELRTVKANNRAEINKYKNELKTLRDVMKSFVHQIDSLNTLNIELTAENKKVKQQFSAAKNENKKLTEKYEEAAGKVAVASVIKAVDVNLKAYNHKGKEVTKAKRAKRLGVSFSLDENMIAPRGIKQVYIRITDPQKHVLVQEDVPMFSFQGEEIALSAFREVEYNGEVVHSVVFYENNGPQLLDGIYVVDIFCDGNMIGTTEVVLK